MPNSSFEIVIQSAVDEDFTTAELEFEIELDGRPVTASVRVYHLPEGWRIQLPSFSSADVVFDLDDFLSAVNRGRDGLKNYLNRTGHDRPSDLTPAGKALWGMMKADGTAMGREMEPPAMSSESAGEDDQE